MGEWVSNSSRDVKVILENVSFSCFVSTGCEYGDMFELCKKEQCQTYEEEYARDNCCDTCAEFLFTIPTTVATTTVTTTPEPPVMTESVDKSTGDGEGGENPGEGKKGGGENEVGRRKKGRWRNNRNRVTSEDSGESEGERPLILLHLCLCSVSFCVFEYTSHILLAPPLTSHPQTNQSIK